jgi:putative hemolysin
MNKEAINPDYKPLDVREIIRSKSQRTARMIPGFLYRYLHRTLAIDEVNEVLRLFGHLKNVDFAEAVVKHFNVKVSIVGKEHLPETGRFIFVSNHPLGGFDGGLIFTMLVKQYGNNINVLVNDILMNVKNMEGTFVPINKHGAQAMKHVRELDAIFKSDSQVLTFPAGLVSRRKKGVIEDPEWKKNFVTKAVQHQRDVVPIHITGRCSNFFYAVANLRKLFRIKANLEMFYLPRETFRHKNNRYTITIGKPISYTTFDRKMKPVDWAQQVKRHVYRLPEMPNRPFTIETL